MGVRYRAFKCNSEPPLLFRVVGRLPSRAERSDHDDADRAGVVQASREETAERTSVGEETEMAMGI